MNIITCFPMFYYIFLLNEYIQNNYHNNYHVFKRYATNIMICVSYKLINFYSRNQIYFSKLRRILNVGYTKFAKSNPKIVKFIEDKLPRNTLQNVDFVLDGKVVSSVNSMVLYSNRTILEPLVLDIDFLIYTEINTDNPDSPITYKKIIDKEVYASADKTIFYCEPTDYTFLLTEIIIGDDKIMANLKDPKNNYFVKGNKFDSKFVKYYLNKYNIVNVDNVDNYTIHFLDQNVNEQKVNSNKYIFLEKDKYTIIQN